MKCCVFKRGTIIEINDNIQPGLVFITFATDTTDIYTATILIASDTTLVMDEDYNEITLNDLQVGDLIFVYHSPIMTMTTDIYTATILIASDTTLVMDEDYNEITLNDLQVGDLIFVYHSPIMTMSIPPQTQAFIIEVK